jgi:Zn-dependent protease with chaperone function
MADLVTTTCPQCGGSIVVERRDVVWCDACDWNLDAGSEQLSDGKLERSVARAKQKGERLFLNLQMSEVVRPRSSGTRIASLAVALAIQVTTLAVFAAGVYMIITSWFTFSTVAIGIPLLLLGVVMRPQLGRLERDALTLTPAQAPVLYKLVNRIAGDIGARPVDVIVIDPTFNAAHGQIGFRRRRVLWIGLLLWNVLGDRERIGLLAHEMAHQVNGDLSHGLVVGSALRTLESWMEILDARMRPRGKSNDVIEMFEHIGEALASTAMRILGVGVAALYRFELSLLFQSQQRAEYYADWLAARVASTDAMVSGLDRSHLAGPCLMAIRYAAQRDEPDIWAAERRFVAELSASEWERLRRLDARFGTSVDATHPPTKLRVELLRSKPPQTARITLSEVESAAITVELANARSVIGGMIADAFA